MATSRRLGIAMSGLLVVLAILAILAGLLLPATMLARQSADRFSSKNNLRCLAIASVNHESSEGCFPPGNDGNNFSAVCHLLDELDCEEVQRKIDFKKLVDDKANAAARQVRLDFLLSPNDRRQGVNGFAPTNYLFVAGSKPNLINNDGVFYQESMTRVGHIKDDSSNTLLAIETLKGDNGTKPETVQRQHVLLAKDTLKDSKDDAGIQEWKDGKKIVGIRCASWMDGRFLQGAWTATRLINDERPDVDYEGQGGYSAIRPPGPTVLVIYCDASVRTLNPRIELKVLKGLATRAGNDIVSGDE